MLILGDFNIKSDAINTPEAQTLGNFLDLFNLQNYVTFPTHNKGHTLDLVLTDINSTTLTKVTQDDFISDHYFVDCEFAIQRICRETWLQYSRNIKQMDNNRFQQEINASLPSISHETSVDNKTDKYHSTLENIIEKLAPLRKKRLQQEIKQPWYDELVTNEVWLKCMKERKWKDSGNEYDYVALQYQKKHVRKIIHAKQKQYYHGLFNNISRDSKRLYAEANKLLFRKEALPLPEEKNPKMLAERFNKCFTSKIEKIMAGLVPTEIHPIDKSYIESTLLTHLSFTHFNVLSCDNNKRLVKTSATKSYTLDPIPTSLLKEHLEDFIPILTDIIQSSLQSGKFPDILKNAAVRPLLKKANLPVEDKYYRSVSNLSCLGKLIERAAYDQIVDFASSTGNIENNQSAYRARCSTKPVLLKVKSDLLHALDKQEVTCLVCYWIWELPLIQLTMTYFPIDFTLDMN